MVVCIGVCGQEQANIAICLSIVCNMCIAHEKKYVLAKSILIKQVIVYLFIYLSVCSSMNGQTARPNGPKFGG